MRATVIGTIFKECKGYSAKQFNYSGRNLGKVVYIHGGVGRNVAESLALMNISTSFVTTVDGSDFGKQVIERLRDRGVNTRHVIVTDQGIGTWLALIDNFGSLVGSISEMPDLAQLELYIKDNIDAVIEATDAIALELDLTMNISKVVVREAKKLGRVIYGIPGNLSVISQNLEILKELDYFVCNDAEAEILFKHSIDKAKYKQVILDLKAFVNKLNMKCMVITLGKYGSVYYDSQRDIAGYQPAVDISVVDTTGAGDSFFAGIVAATMNGDSISDAVKYGTIIASSTIQTMESVSDILAINN